MMDCIICQDSEKNTLYENDKIKILLALEPASIGHLQIFPRQHYSIFEEVPDELVTYMAFAANKLSMLLFEALKVHGTNIIIQNGVPSGQTLPHFSLHVIPRRTDDGLRLEWDMNQANPENLENIHRIITEGLSKPEIIAIPEPKKQEIVPMEVKPAQEVQEEVTSDETDDEREKKINYYLKSLERIP